MKRDLPVSPLATSFIDRRVSPPPAMTTPVSMKVKYVFAIIIYQGKEYYMHITPARSSTLMAFTSFEGQVLMLKFDLWI